MAKYFSPVRIQNPTSLQQITKVRPGQEICLYLADQLYGNHTVDVSSNVLSIQQITFSGPGKLYKISHDSCVHDWADYSSSLIGEIWIDGKDSIGKIGVLLESKNPEKAQVRTVINPDCYDMRIYPYNILEVIVYDKRFGFHDDWSWEWKPLEDIEIQQIGYDQLCLNSWDHYFQGVESPQYMFARHPRADVDKNGMLTRQHHFWFRLNNKVFNMITCKSSIVHIGNMVISGIANKYQQQFADKTSHYLSLYVDFRKKCYQQMQDTLNIKMRNESTPYLYGPANKQRINTSSYKPPPKVVLPEIRDVDIKLIETPGEITGCTSLTALNENYNSAKYDYWEDDCCDYTQHHKNYHHPKWWRKMN